MSDKPGEWNEDLQKFNPLTGEPPASERVPLTREQRKARDEKKEQE